MIVKFILINRYSLNGSSSKEIFAELPGYSDNIKITSRQTLFVPFNIVKNFTLGSYGLIAEYDLKGNPIKSWHDQNGKIVSAVSQITQFQDKLYLGSLLNDYIATIDYKNGAEVMKININLIILVLLNFYLV